MPRHGCCRLRAFVLASSMGLLTRSTGRGPDLGGEPGGGAGARDVRAGAGHAQFCDRPRPCQ
eukprot:2312614-Rhodomonas_salina.10